MRPQVSILNSQKVFKFPIAGGNFSLIFSGYVLEIAQKLIVMVSSLFQVPDVCVLGRIVFPRASSGIILSGKL